MNQENNFIYTPSSTDITIRWRKLYNYIPASEQASYQNQSPCKSRYLHSPTFCDNSRILGVCKDLGRGVM